MFAYPLARQHFLSATTFEHHPIHPQTCRKGAESVCHTAGRSVCSTMGMEKLIPCPSADMYTVLMTDPDAPSPSELSCKSWLHWIYVDASGSHLTGGKAISAYTPPTPPKGTHTYHVALYKQSKSLAGIEGPGSRCARPSFLHCCTKQTVLCAS